MKLIEHLEHVIQLVETSALHSEIKGSLVAMHEELEGAQQAAANQDALATENAALRSENAALRAENQKLKQAPPPPDLGRWGGEQRVKF